MSELNSGTVVGKPTLLFSWVAPHRVFIERDKRWFMGLFVLVAIIAILLMVISEITLALFFVAFGFVIFILNYAKPEMVEYQILSSGLKIGEKIFLWKDLEQYWIETKGVNTMLYIKTKLLYPDHLEMLLEDQSADEVDGIVATKLLYKVGKSSNFMEFIDGVVTGVSLRLPTKMPKKEYIRKEENKKITPVAEVKASTEAATKN